MVHLEQLWNSSVRLNYRTHLSQTYMPSPHWYFMESNDKCRIQPLTHLLHRWSTSSSWCRPVRHWLLPSKLCCILSLPKQYLLSGRRFEMYRQLEHFGWYLLVYRGWRLIVLYRRPWRLFWADGKSTCRWWKSMSKKVGLLYSKGIHQSLC